MSDKRARIVYQTDNEVVIGTPMEDGSWELKHYKFAGRTVQKFDELDADGNPVFPEVSPGTNDTPSLGETNFTFEEVREKVREKIGDIDIVIYSGGPLGDSMGMGLKPGFR